MPNEFASVPVLRDAFRRSIKRSLGTCEEIHPGHFVHRCRLLATATWTEIRPNVHAIQVAEAEVLIRGSWRYTIDRRTKNQMQLAQAQIDEAASFLASAVLRGQTVKGTFDFPPTEISESGETVTCLFRGVVYGQASRTAPF
jgi:hypothetical protein